MNQAFIVTKEHRRFTEFANAVRKEKTIGICHGAARVGKINSARRYANWDALEAYINEWRPRGDQDAPHYALLNRSGTVFYTPEVLCRPKDLMHDIDRWQVKVGICVDEHLRSLMSEPERVWQNDVTRLVELLIIDEAERLIPNALGLLRDQHDRTHIAMILIGMPGIDERFRHYPQLYSPLGFSHQYRALCREELLFVLDRHWKRLGRTLNPDDFTDAQATAAIERITDNGRPEISGVDLAYHLRRHQHRMEFNRSARHVSEGNEVSIQDLLEHWRFRPKPMACKSVTHWRAGLVILPILCAHPYTQTSRLQSGLELASGMARWMPPWEDGGEGAESIEVPSRASLGSERGPLATLSGLDTISTIVESIDALIGLGLLLIEDRSGRKLLIPNPSPEAAWEHIGMSGDALVWARGRAFSNDYRRVASDLRNAVGWLADSELHASPRTMALRWATTIEEVIGAIRLLGGTSQLESNRELGFDVQIDADEMLVLRRGSKPNYY